MRHPNGRSFAIGRIVAVLVLALAVATPASAQFGGLKKKLKGDAVNKAVDKAVDGSAGGDSAKAPTETGAAASTAGGAGPTAKAVGGQTPATPETTGGTLVMTPETVEPTDRRPQGWKGRAGDREEGRHAVRALPQGPGCVRGSQGQVRRGAADLAHALDGR